MFERAGLSVILLSILIAVFATGAAADTGTFTLLHTFADSPDGHGPLAGVSVDAGGNVYGTTTAGGDPNCLCGIVYKIAPGGVETILLSFDGANGSQPQSAPLIDKNGNLFGTTSLGGAGPGLSGDGTIFEITAAGKAKVLYSFCTADNCADGSYPVANLIKDKNGNFYGITQKGGAYGNGVIFEYTAARALNVLYSFEADGVPPANSTLVRDSAGNFYGTTLGNGGSCGTVYKLTAAGKEKTLYAFNGGNDGCLAAGLTIDSSGNLFGTTTLGGAYDNGIVFKLGPDGIETVLYSFEGGADGIEPVSPLVLDKKGNLYGESALGRGTGNIFKLTPAGKLTVLHTFSQKQGNGLLGGLLFHKGAFYGAAYDGGSDNVGTVFEYVK